MTPYVVVQAGDCRVAVWRGEPDGDAVPYELRIGERVAGALVAYEYQTPHVAAFDRHVALWAGARLLVTDVDTGAHGTYEDGFGDMVALMRAGERWLVVSELAVSLRGDDLATEHARFDYNEVFLQASLRGDAVILTDFNGVEIVLDAATLAPRA